MASGVANARELIEEIRAGRAQYDFVEVRHGWVRDWQLGKYGGQVGGGHNARQLIEEIRAGRVRSTTVWQRAAPVAASLLS